jgi:hypothetical protein
VQVGRDAGNAGDAEVEIGNQIAKPAHEGQHEAPDAGVDVTENAVLERQSGKLRDRIDDAVGVGRRRAGDENRIRRQRGADGGDVGTEAAIERRAHGPDVKVVGRLFEGRDGR